MDDSRTIDKKYQDSHLEIFAKLIFNFNSNLNFEDEIALLPISPASQPPTHPDRKSSFKTQNYFNFKPPNPNLNLNPKLNLNANPNINLKPNLNLNLNLNLHLN